MLIADKKFIFLFFGRFVQTVLAVLSIRLLTGFLSQQEVGYQYLINSIILWFSLVLINPVGMFVNRHLHEWKASGQLYFYLNQLNLYFCAIALASVPIVFSVRYFFGVGYFLPAVELIIFVLFYIFFSTWFQTLVSIFNLFDSQKVFVILSIASQAIGLALASLLVKYNSSDAISWMTGLLMGQVLALLGAVYLLLRQFPAAKFSNKPAKGESLFARNTFNFCIPVAITTLFMWFMNQGYRLIVEKNLGAEVLASIGVGLGIAASLSSVVESITTQYFFPGYYASLSNSTLDQRTSAWHSLWRKTLVVYVISCFLVLSVSSLVVRVLTAGTFNHVVPYVCIGAFIELFRQLSNIAYLVSHAEKKTSYTVMPYLVGGLFLLVVLLVLVLMKKLAVDSILAALLAAGVLTYSYNLLVVKRLIGSKFDLVLLMKLVFASLPLLLPFVYEGRSQNFLVEAGLACLSGSWFIAELYFFLKGEIKLTSPN